MSSRDNRPYAINGGARRITVALLLLLLFLVTAIASSIPASAQRPNGAGIVIRHGDGTLIQAYVQFEEESITSEELLARSGLAVVMSPYGGLGTAVCSIDGEGCPADNCFCQSYTNPAYFWHFYVESNGGWVEQLMGPSSRTVSDGDVDGWSWTSGESNLPAVTIDEIALANNVDRNPPEPTPTPTEPPPTPTNTPEPTATFTPLPTATATQAPVEATATSPSNSIATATPSPAGQAAAQSTATQPAEATETATTARATVTTTVEPTVMARITPSAQRTNPSPISSPTIAPSPGSTTVAVIILPNGTPMPLKLNNEDDDGTGTSGSLLVFGGMVAVAAAAGVVVMLRQRGTG